MKNNINRILNSTKRINYKLFAALLLMGLLPTIYTTVRIFFLGQLPADWGFNIASQLSWVNLIYEIVQESLILPLFFFIGAVVADKPQLENRVRTGLLLTFVINGVIAILLIVFARPIIVGMAQDVALVDATVDYIRLETIANIFMLMVKFIIVVLVTIKKEKYLYIILALQMVLSVTFDVFLVSTLPVSLNIGVNGIAISNIIANIAVLAVAVAILKKEGIDIFAKRKLDFAWFKQFGKISSLSGLETLVRNFAFMMMIVRMVNVVGEQGTFWVANSFIWGWLLLPVLQLGELVKRDCGENKNAISENTLGYFAITTAIVAIWVVSIPLWKPFLSGVLLLENANEVFHIAIISLAFYVLFAYNNVIDSIFYGIGKTSYMLFQSVAVNTIFYGTAFVLYATGVYVPTLMSIALMFATGTAIDSILTYFIFAWMCKKEKISIGFK
ncbi:MAG: multidrug transporter [Bacillota bacterium]